MIDLTFLKNTDDDSIKNRSTLLNAEETLQKVSTHFVEDIKNNKVEQLNDLTVGYLHKSKTKGRICDYVAEIFIARKAKTDEMYLYNLSYDKDMIIFFDRYLNNVVGAIVLGRLAEKYNDETWASYKFKQEISHMYNLKENPNIFVNVYINDKGDK